jgi:hypothetical protein
MLNPADLARIEALENQIAKLQLAISSEQAGLRNRVFVNNGSGGTPLTAGMLLVYAAAQVPIVQSSGLFDVSVSFQFSGATAATSSTIAVQSQVNTSAIAMTNTTPVGSPNVPGSTGIFVDSAAAGILVTGGPFSALTQVSQAFTTATAQTTGTYAWRGLCGNSVTVGGPVPFLFGTFPVFLFQLNANTSSWTIAGLSITITELIK